MKIATIFVSLGILAGVASAATSYDVRFRNPTAVAGKEMKPGEYSLSVNGDTATLKGEKSTAQAKVTSEKVAEKYASTTVHYRIDNGKYTVEEIDLGGTTTKLKFDASGSASGN